MVAWVEHEGRKILRMDVEGLTVEQYVQEIKDALKMVVESKPAPNSVLLLVRGQQPRGALDVSSAAWKDFQAGAKGLMRAQAVAGLNGFMRVVARLVQRDLYFAATDEDALAWLMKQ